MSLHGTVASAIGAIIALLLACSGAMAGSATLEFNDWYGDDGHPNGTPPWLVATFEDTGVDTVKVTLQLLLVTTSEHVKQINFNLDPDLDSSGLGIVDGSYSGPSLDGFQVNTDSLSAGPGRFFDIQLNWKNHDFSGNTEVQFELSGVTGLIAKSFLFMNVKDANGPLAYAAAHIGGIGDDDRSSWIASVPLPAPVYLAAAGLLLLPFAVRSRL